jgi:DNA repair and recombination protein RAD54B
MSQYINPRGQKRKPEDGLGLSGHSDKKLREENGAGPDPNGELYWVVQWYALTYPHAVLYSPAFARRSPQHKKHKTWDGDGVLIIRGSTHFKLLDQSSATCATNYVSGGAKLKNPYTRLASGSPNPIPTKLETGVCLKLGEKEAHLDFPISRQDFLSGRHCSPIHNGDVDIAPVRTSVPSIKQFVPPKQSRLSIGSSSTQKKSISLHPVNLIKPPVVNAPNSSKTIPDSHWSAQWSVESLFP